MSKRQRNRWRRSSAWVRAAWSRVWDAACRLWRTACRRCRRVQIEVMVADKEKRRTMEWELRSGLRRMQRVLGAPLPAELAIVAQQVIQTDRPLAGCYQVGRRPDGSRFALVRLALEMNGHPLSVNQVLAVLVGQVANT